MRDDVHEIHVPMAYVCRSSDSVYLFVGSCDCVLLPCRVIPTQGRKWLVRSSDAHCVLRQPRSRPPRRSRPELLEAVKARVAFPSGNWERTPCVDHALDRWINRQRSLIRAGQVSAEELQELKYAGLEKATTARRWARRYKQGMNLIMAKYKMNTSQMQDEVHAGRSGCACTGNAQGKSTNTDTREQRIPIRMRAAELKEVRLTLESKTVEGGKWDDNFLKLREFVRERNHANVSLRDKGHEVLARWVSTQRTMWRRGELSEGRYRKLSGVGMAWDLNYERWKKHFYQLVKFKEKFGHCTVVQSEQYKDFENLAKWCVRQRYQYRNGTLDDERRRRLEGIRFCFNRWSERFDKQLIQLRRFIAKHGHSNVPRQCEEFPDLASFTASVCARYRRGKLSISHYRQLRELGFSFFPQNDHWEVWLERLEAFVKRTGHCSPSFIEDPSLNSWLRAQLKKTRQGQLEPERKWKLEAIGVDWRKPTIIFDERYRELCDFRKEHGNLEVPTGTPLSQWICLLRSRGKYQISRRRVELLRKIGFRWD